MEWFLKIENIFGRKHVPFVCQGIVKGVSPKLNDFIYLFIFSGKKFPEFPCQHEQVLLFMEHIIDANENISGGNDLFLIFWIMNDEY